MHKYFLLTSVILFSFAGFSQKPIEIKNFSSAQKAEWDIFLEYWNGNGNGTCMPIMETQIDSGKCTQFEFMVDVTIGNNGKISKVKVIESKVLCENKIIQEDLLDCFTTALKDDWGTTFKKLKGRVIRGALL